MIAFYNEIDPYAAQWLRNLIAAGHIAPGVVDERSIEDIKPEELYGFTQCHFFAGVGVWSLALRNARWPDNRPIWTGSCPCQPFSAAGQGNGFSDERHLWPAFHHLIAECRPASVLGEQVASKDADPWIDLVHADMEALGYAFGSVPFPSAGIGAPHIRDRLYWVANADGGAGGQGRKDVRGRINGGNAQPWSGLGGGRMASGMAHADGRNASAERQQRSGEQRQQSQDGGCGVVAPGGLADPDSAAMRKPGPGCVLTTEKAPARRSDNGPGGAGDVGGLGHPTGPRLGGCGHGGDPRQGRQRGAVERASTDGGSGPTNGFWRDADWLGCRDGKWRPVEPGAFPLAHGATARVGRLRAYGNAINAEAARVFIEAVMEAA